MTALCLGIMFHQGDYPFLCLHMPYLINGFRDENKVNILAVSDDINSQAADFLRSAGVDVEQIPFGGHWANALNCMIDIATAKGYKKMLRLDADELVFVEDVPKLDIALEAYSLLLLNRRNFWYSRIQWDVSAWPDTQTRAWRLDDRSRYVSARHEGIVFSGDQSEVATSSVVIYHYGDASTTGYMRKALKYYNYDRQDKGLPPVDSLPPDVRPGANVALYEERQPIDPAVIGLTAPFTK